MRGEITCSVWIWGRPQVKVGGGYRLGEGLIEVTSIRRNHAGGRHARTGETVRLLGCCRSSEGGEAWTGRERLPDRLRIPRGLAFKAVTASASCLRAVASRFRPSSSFTFCAICACNKAGAGPHISVETISKHSMLP